MYSHFTLATLQESPITKQDLTFWLKKGIEGKFSLNLV